MAWQRKNPARQPDRGHLHRRAAQHGVGQALSRAARAWRPSIWSTEIDPKVDPLSPDNKMIFATGPLTGTMASTGGRYSVITKGPLTGAIACSNSGGYLGAELKMAGWDMIIFEGRAPKPVYLHIENDKAELLDASDMWGKTTWETEPVLQGRAPGPADPGLLDRPRRRKRGAVCRRHQRPAPRRRTLGRRRGDGLEESQGDRRARHQGRRRHQGPEGFMKATAEEKKVLADNGVTGRACRSSAPRC